MKIIYYFLVVSVCGIASNAVAQNAYYDAKTIDCLLKRVNLSDSLETREKLVKLVLPYFTIDGVLRREMLHDFASPQLNKQVDMFFQQKQRDENLIDAFATYLGEDYTFFDSQKSLKAHKKRLVVIRKQFNNITMFQLDTNAMTDYHGGAFEDSLKSMLKLDTSQKEDLRRLTQYLDLKDHNPKALSDSLYIVKTSVSIIIVLRNKIAKELSTTLNKKFIEFVGRQLRTTNESQKASTANLAISHFASMATNVVTPSNSNIGGTASLSNFRMPTEAELIDALAIYMAKRFKQEVALSFVSMLRLEINKQELVKEMFPNTVQLLLEGETYELPKLGSVWHYSMAEDITNLPLNLKESSFIKRAVGDISDSSYYSLFTDLVSIGEMARKKNSLPDMVILYKSKAEPLRNKYVSSAFEVLNLINTELVKNNADGENKFWINWQEFNKLSPGEWDTFLTLIAFRYNSELFSSMQIPRQWSPEKRQQFKSYLMKVLIALNSFETSQIELLKNFEKNPTQAFKGISFWDLQQNLFSIIMDDRFFTFSEKGKNTLSLINRSVGLYRLMEQKNYPAMVNESIAITEQLFPEQSSRLNELLIKPWRLGNPRFEDAAPTVQNFLSDINSFYTQVREIRADTVKLKEVLERKAVECNIDFDTKVWETSQKDHLNSLLKLISAKFYRDLAGFEDAKRLRVVKSEKGFFQLLATARTATPVKWADVTNKRGTNFTAVLKTAEFFTDVMSASNSKELSNVIDAHAMTPNSYKIKRNSRFSVDLNSYIGFYGGGEFLGKEPPSGINSKAVVWGLSAPIGITISRGTRKDASPNKPASFFNRYGDAKSLKGNSFSLNLTLVDIAAAVSYRLSDDGEEALPKNLKWSQLLSPGVHARWGIKNTPLCFSIGAQYTPQIRNLNQPNQDQQAYRAYAGLFFDLPLFNIYKR